MSEESEDTLLSYPPEYYESLLGDVSMSPPLEAEFMRLSGFRSAKPKRTNKDTRAAKSTEEYDRKTKSNN